MATSSAAETEAVPMRRRGYEADSTSASSPVPKVVLCERSPPEEPENPDERTKTLSLSGSTGSLFSSLLSSDCGRGAWSSKGVFTCHLCSFVGTSRESFDHHMVDCHYIYRCTECSYSARTQGRLKRHLRDTHSNSSTIASQRGGPARPNSQRPAVGDQLKKSRRQKTIRCKYCKFITVEKNEFWLHLSNHIPADKQLRCNRCPFVTDLKHHHEYHLRGHDGFKPFLCQKCGYSCVNKSMLNSHSKSHSNVYRFRCAVCSFAAKYSHALKLHVVKYGHSAGPVLNQDGSLSVAEGAASAPAFPVLHRERRILVETQISGAFERSLHHQDMKLSAKQMTGLAEIYDVESHPMLVTSALQGERPFVVPKYNFSSPTRSGMSVFPRDGEAISSQVTHGGTVVRHDGNFSISTSSGHALKPELTEATSVSIEYANSPREVLGDYAGHPSAITTTEEYSQYVESPFEVQKKRLLEEGPTLNLPLGSVGANFPSLTTSHFRCTTVSPDGNTADLSSSQHLRQKRIPQSLPLPSDLNESDAIRFCPSMVTTPGKVTTASTNARPFQLANGYSTPTLVPSIDLENGSDHGQPRSLMSSTEESSQSAEIGEFISAGDTRWDNVNIEEPLDLTIRNGITSESRATPTFWDGLCVNELTLAPPYHQMFFQATFSSSSSTSPISYHVEQAVPSYMSQTTSSCHSPPPLLPLSLTLPRSETKGPDRFRLNDNEEMRVPVTASEDPDHSGDEDRWDYCLPSEDQDSFPVELEKVNEESTGGTETDPTFNDREFECQHCRMIFQDYVMFSIHSDHHGYLDPFECNMCGQKCEDRIQFFLHISRVAHD